MNRSERRKLGKSAPKPKTYVLTEDQIAKIKNDAVDEAMAMLLAIPVVVLHDKFGFGRIRLDRFTHYAFSWINSLQSGEVKMVDLVKICEDEAGFTIVKPNKEKKRG